MARPKKSENSQDTKTALLAAATELIRTNGFGATTVDQLCRQAGVSKGTFFHYFKSKEELAVEAAKNWSKVTTEFFKSAPYTKLKDPLDRILGYIKFRKDLLKGELPAFTCLVGTMVQETFNSSSDIREACYESIFGHAKNLLENDIEEAMKLYAPTAKWTAKSLALHTQAVLQGSFILAKASEDLLCAKESVAHLENYIRLLFKNE